MSALYLGAIYGKLRSVLAEVPFNLTDRVLALIDKTLRGLRLLLDNCVSAPTASCDSNDNRDYRGDDLRSRKR